MLQKNLNIVNENKLWSCLSKIDKFIPVKGMKLEAKLAMLPLDRYVYLYRALNWLYITNQVDKKTS